MSEAVIARSGSGLSLLLPWPPSRNALWRAVSMGGRRKIVLKSAVYNEWWKDAQRALAAQRHGLISGPIRIVLETHPPSRREYDPDNYSKAVMDFLVGEKIIDGDSNKTVWRLTIDPHDKGETCGVWAHIDQWGLGDGFETKKNARGAEGYPERGSPAPEAGREMEIAQRHIQRWRGLASAEARTRL